MSVRGVRPLSVSALPVASLLTLITAIAHVTAGGETPTAIGVILAVALTRGVWVALTTEWTRRLNSRHRHHLALAAVAALQAITHHLFGFGSGEASIVAHHGHVMVHDGGHAAHGLDVAMLAAHASVAFVMVALVAGCDDLIAHIAAKCADLRRRWRVLVRRPLIICTLAPARCEAPDSIAFTSVWRATILPVRGPPLGA